MGTDIESTEKCGIFAAYAPGMDIPRVAVALGHLKKRGEDSFVLATRTGSETTIDHLNVTDQLETEILSILLKYPQAYIYISHNRYITSGADSEQNVQPIMLSSEDENYKLVFKHNGNLPEAIVKHLRLMLSHPLPEDASDSRVMAQVLIDKRSLFDSWEETFTAVLPHFQGAFSLICVTEENVIYAIRDPWGFRPLCIGKKGESWVAASESVVFNHMDVELEREVTPGEIVCLLPDGTSVSTQYATLRESRFCTLEEIYFANIRSKRYGKTIEEDRLALGRAVGRRFLEKNIFVDVVVPVLNSGKRMSMGVSEVLDLGNTEAIELANQKRTFIVNTQAKREQAVHKKHVVNGSIVEGQRILVCDDSVVRGTSMGALVEMIKEHKPAEIHLVFGSEPVIDTCDWGINISTKEELIVYQLIQSRPDWKNRSEYFAWLSEVERLVAKEWGVDSVTYLDRTSVNEALQKTDDELCRHCFGGEEPILGQKAPTYLTHTHQSATLVRA